MAVGTMAAAAKADHGHASGDRSFDSGRAVLDNDAVFRPHVQLTGRKQEKIGGRFSTRNLRGAEDMRLEQRQEPGHRQRLPDAVDVAVRGDAARRRQFRKKLLDPRYRSQFTLESDVYAGAHRLKEALRQRASEPGLDFGGQGKAVLADAEDHRLGDRDLKTPGDQALAEHAPKDDLAVDQHTVAIENDQGGHERSLTASGRQDIRRRRPSLTFDFRVQASRRRTPLTSRRRLRRRGEASAPLSKTEYRFRTETGSASY